MKPSSKFTDRRDSHYRHDYGHKPYSDKKKHYNSGINTSSENLSSSNHPNTTQPNPDMESFVPTCFTCNVKGHKSPDDSSKGRVRVCLNTCFSAKPGNTQLARFSINTSAESPISLKPYHLPLGMEDSFKEERDELLEADIIEPSQGEGLPSYSS